MSLWTIEHEGRVSNSIVTRSCCNCWFWIGFSHVWSQLFETKSIYIYRLVFEFLIKRKEVGWRVAKNKLLRVWRLNASFFGRTRRVLIFWAFLWRLDRRKRKKKNKRGKKGAEAGISSGAKEIKNKETRGSGLETNDQGIISEKGWKGES